MPREINRLSARTVATLATPGRHADGGGLYLVVDKSGARRWAFLYRRDNRLREMGLGGVLVVPLARARQLAADARQELQRGKDPIIERQRAATRRKPSFGEAADDFLTAMEPEFRNAKHFAQWKMTLEHYAASLRPKAVDEVTTEDVLAVLKPIWSEKPETASRLRGRIERVLNAAKAKGHRSGENPAAWRGHLENVLPKRTRLSRGHHAAMPYNEVPSFIGALRQRAAVAARALEFAILTASRSGEVYGAKWAEIDKEAAVWTVPANRMKAGREHRVPLTQRALDILREMATASTEPQAYVFPGQRHDQPLSVMAMEMILRRMKVDVTVHGFRSSFRDWCGEATNFPREIAEAALAHVVGDQTERAYRRGDALEKRRKLMAAWANYCRPKDAATKSSSGH